MDTKVSTTQETTWTITLDSFKLFKNSRAQSDKLTDKLIIPPLQLCFGYLLHFKTPEDYISRQDPSEIWVGSEIQMSQHLAFTSLSAANFKEETVLTHWDTARYLSELKTRAFPELFIKSETAELTAEQAAQRNIAASGGPATEETMDKQETDIEEQTTETATTHAEGK